jgi:glucose/arabinose dehydrogenase
VTAPPGETRWLFILQKGGAIRLFDRQTGQMAAENLLTISPISTNSERGLLGLAFHPGFSDNGFFFVNFTNSVGSTVIRRYTMATQSPYSVAAGSALDILTIPQDFANHNAGWLDFSPIDGYLYIPMGDGGSGNDPNRRAQDRTNLLGSIVRIDVDGDDFPGDATRNYRIPPDNPFMGQSGRPEIWAYGLRNPWRNSFDRETGDLWIADVGQSAREEINFQSAISSGGENYGWRLKEGTLRTHLDPEESTEGMTDPIYEYDFSDGSKAIAGGYVYRGEAMPQLRGEYFFADYIADFVKSFRYSGTGKVNPADVVDWTAQFGNISNPASFGEDGVGELFIVSLFGQVYQITQSPWYLWRNRHFSHEQIMDPEISGPGADPDGDGLGNLLEFALGLDPLSGDGLVPVQTGMEEIEGELYLTLTAAKAPEATDVSLVVESSSDLTGGWTTGGTVVLVDNAQQLRVRDSAPVGAADRRFLRLRARLVEP